MLRRIQRDQVRVGMFVHSLDGSWFQHPFWKRRFLLDKPADLATLLESEVASLVIDTGRGCDVASGRKPGSRKLRPTVESATRVKVGSIRPLAPPARSRQEAEWDRQAKAAAEKVVARTKEQVRQIFVTARKKKTVDIAAIAPLVDEICVTIEKNQKAFLAAVRFKSKEQYAQLHAVAVCGLMAGLARQLDFDPETVAELGTAGLLIDIGKAAVPVRVLNKPDRLTEEEFARVQTHPELGARLLAKCEGVSEAVLDVCRHHHEKMDGTGYPEGLGGEQISVAARMGAICDVFDALTSDRPYKQARSAQEAIWQMRDWDGQFDTELLFRFMQSINMFPAGMLVQLRTNRLGIVLECAHRTAAPQVLAFYATREKEMIEPEMVTIGRKLSLDWIIAEADPASWSLSDELLEEVVRSAQTKR